MAHRHLLRSIVMQSLFEWDFMNHSAGDIDVIVKRNTAEFAPSVTNTSFLIDLARGVIAKKDKLDAIIEKAAPDWPIDKISIVDRNVLRIGLYELLFGDKNEVPPKVAINEAIEIAKSFGGESSGRFVNGVLGAVYKELGEPGKNDTSKKQKGDPSTYPVERLIGALIYAKNSDGVFLGFIHDIFGHWTMTKGHMKDGEKDEDGVVRKAIEEMGARVTGVKEQIGFNEYLANDPKTGKIRKQVSYFLAEASFDDLRPGGGGGIDDAKWFRLADVVNLNIYDDILPIVTKGINILLKK